MKTCSRCKQVLDFDAYYTDASKKDGRSSRCISCLKDSHRQYYEQNKNQLASYAKKIYHQNREKIRERRKELRQLNPEKKREEARRNYCPKKNKLRGWKQAGIVGMTLEKYQQLLDQQNYSCAICNTHESKFKKALSLDHDHSTGKARGLLCDNCNRALGYLKESETIVNNLLTYIRCHK